MFCRTLMDLLNALQYVVDRNRVSITLTYIRIIFGCMEVGPKKFEHILPLIISPMCRPITMYRIYEIEMMIIIILVYYDIDIQNVNYVVY